MSICVYLLSEENKNNPFFDEIQFLYDSHPNVDIHHIQVDESQFNELPTPGEHLSYGIYYKLAIHRLCPATGTVLHLDADTICDGSLVDLISLDMENWTLAAVPSSKPEIVRLDLPLDRPKFNVGLLIINLEQWKKNDVEERARNYIRKNKPELPEQDAINKILNKDDTTKYIPPKYNTTKKWVDEFDRVNEEPIIIHYNGPDKPWRYITERKKGEVWWKYAGQTPFKNYVTDKGVKEVIWIQLRNALRNLPVGVFN